MNPNLEIAINNRVLNAILSRGWKDYDNFSSKLTCQIIENSPRVSGELIQVIRIFQSPFYDLNHISEDTFIKILPIEEMIGLFSKYVDLESLAFADVFPETSSVNIAEGKKCLSILANLAENAIQSTLMDSLREKNATNCRIRAKDTVLEVADLEHFSLKVKGFTRTFAGVVKGYKSVNKKSITWEDISHQVTKAYNRTNPDYILLVLAKNPSDSVISDFTQYSKAVGKKNLVIFCDPLNLARFLRSRKII